jgi:selenocysteine lyase/cysteine desulfurase
MMAVAAAGAWAVAAKGGAPALPSPGGLPGDEAYWRGIAGQYDLPPGVIQLENGNWGMMACPVAQAYERRTEMVNSATSLYSRSQAGPDIMAVRGRAAAMLGVQPDELAFTRGATESLLTLIGGYNRLRPGDEILFADLDYDSMQAGFRWLKDKRGVGLVTFAIPEPATYQGLIDAYARMLDAHPKIRLMLLTHVGHRTGLVMPVKDILALAKSRGVDVILDSAHAWGQLDFDLGALGADFVGLTCQKWIGAPMGVGLVYIRKDRLDAIDPAMGAEDDGRGGILSRVHTGTANFAAFLALADALDFHEAIGIRAKEARLRHLRDRWAEHFRDDARIEILTPSDPRLTCALTAFRLPGRISSVDNKALAARLFEQSRIFTVPRDGVAKGACVRVTPGLFTGTDEIDHLIAALGVLLRTG